MHPAAIDDLAIEQDFLGAGGQPLAYDLQVCREAPVAELVGALEAQQFDQAWRQNWSSLSANTVRPAALSGPSWARAGGRMTSA